MVSRTSRKKSKGKDRKAKKEASKAENERVRARELWLGWALGKERITGMPTISCKHGRDDVVMPDNLLDHPISSFLDDFTVRCLINTSVRELIEPLFQTHPQVWNNDGNKKMTISIMINMGTNLLMSDKEDVLIWSMHIAKVIAVLERYNAGTNNIDTAYNNLWVQTKIRDLHSVNSSGKRDALKFFSKRVPCSCLKERHQEARNTIPKVGKCYGCRKEKERVALSVCSKCMLMQYCSKECQVADWSQHKEECDIYWQS